MQKKLDAKKQQAEVRQSLSAGCCERRTRLTRRVALQLDAIRAKYGIAKKD